jgi:hypothetical protein
MSIQFKAKPIQIYNYDDTPSHLIVKIPKLTRHHCDMAAMRKRQDQLGRFADSDIFEAMLRRSFSDKFGQYTEYFRLDQLPEEVEITENAFLVTVHINL